MNEKLSVLIPTLNEEENISGCIDSVREIADEILVMDNFSTDRTAEISRAAGAIVHQRKFDHFAANKNAGIDLLQNDWVLILDADERLTPLLRDEIRNAILKPQVEAYAILRDTFFCGRLVRCWSGKKVVRLFRKGKARYGPERFVHEHLIIQGQTGILRNPMEHYTFRSHDQYLPKIQLYTRLAALEAFQRGERASWTALIFAPPLRFFKNYVLRAGFLDGIPGLLISWLSAYSMYLKEAKLWEMGNSKAVE